MPSSVWQKRSSLYILLLTLLSGLAGCNSGSRQERGAEKAAPRSGEIIYHIFQRSFYDSNNDLNGDLNGIRQKLDYLQQLGVTSILLTPLYESVYYHNYFSSDFSKIDPAYGTMQDYLDLVKEIHRRGMKLYMDMETQYVTEDHPWYKDSYGHPGSPYTDYIIYNDSLNKKPETIVYGLDGLRGYNNVYRKITTVNLNSEKVKAYNYELFRFWVDPNKDGKFDDGVDGFRLDHMMDDLDNKGKLTDLFATFWKPLLTKLKQLNPRLSNVAEQANWASFGMDYLERGGVDRVFAFRLAFAIRNFDKAGLEAAADSTLLYNPPGKQQVVFIENHDTPRFSSAVHHDPGKLRIGAALNLLIGGVPSIYYGQELGMEGIGSPGKYGMTDANEIPDREAFEWYRQDTGKGMAIWYKNSGPWWDSTNLHPNDGISLEEEENDTTSLWNFYRKMIRLRKGYPELEEGSYQTLKNHNGQVFSFLRYEQQQGIIVAVNLSAAPQEAIIDLDSSKVKPGSKKLLTLYGSAPYTVSPDTLSVHFPPYGIQVWKIK